MSYGAKLPAYFTHSPSASIRAAGALFSGAQAPLAEARLELAAEQESDDPATEQQQELECFGGHQRQSPGLYRNSVSSIGNQAGGQYSLFGEPLPSIARAAQCGTISGS